MNTYRRRLALLLALVPLVACQKGGEPDESEPSGATEFAGAAQPAARPAAGEQLVEIVDFAGLEPALAKFRGHGVLLNFWATWCVPCVQEFPELQETAHAFREQGGQVVAVSYDLMVPGVDRATIEGTLRAWLRDRSIDFPILIYDESDYEAINELYQLPGEVPVTLALDAEGRIVDREDGKADRARFDELMRRALGE